MRQQNPRTTLFTNVCIVFSSIYIKRVLFAESGFRDKVSKTELKIFTITPVSYFPPAPKPVKEQAILSARNKC